MRNHVPVFTLALWAGFFAYPLQAQIPVRDVQAFEGPWECRNTIGVAGVFITALSFLGSKTDQQDVTSQAFNIRVYQRQGKQEHSGYFSPSTNLDRSKRLIIHFKDGTDIPPFDLDVSFDPSAGHWTGYWSFCDKSPEVVLERPRPDEGIQPSAFVGDWEGYPDPTAKLPSASGTLHIRQSYDGGLAAWLDRTLYNDQRNGEELSVPSVTQSVIALVPVNPLGPKYRYEGTLSSDGKQMSGQWRSDPPGGGSLNAPTLYRVLNQSKGRN